MKTDLSAVLTPYLRNSPALMSEESLVQDREIPLHCPVVPASAAEAQLLATAEGLPGGRAAAPVQQGRSAMLPSRTGVCAARSRIQCLPRGLSI